MVKRISVLAALLWFGWTSSFGFAQELTTDAERDWRAVRSSEDVRTKIMAERWFNAIRQQEWSDASGKFKVSAKYVDHDPNLKWVKLRTIRGTGKERQVKDVEIPLEKLSKSCQARVRTISVLAEKIAEAKEEEAKKEAEEEAGAGAAGGRDGETAEGESMEGETPAEPREGRAPFDRGPAEMDSRAQMAERDSRDDREGAGAEPQGVTDSVQPLPAALPPLPSTATSTTAVAPPVPAEPAEDGSVVPPLDAAQPYFPDADPWRTSYEAFRTVFEKDEIGVISTRERWSGVINLQLFIPHELMASQERGAPPAYVEVPRLAEVGDFQWEAVVAQQPAPDANWAEILGLTPLVDPLRLELRLQDGGHGGNWQGLQVGDTVRFVGRFVGYRGPYGWVADIQLLPADGGRH